MRNIFDKSSKMRSLSQARTSQLLEESWGSQRPRHNIMASGGIANQKMTQGGEQSEAGGKSECCERLRMKLEGCIHM